MSSEKDRRSTFGSRISSIFNTHPHGSHVEPLKSHSQPGAASLKLYKPALINKASNVSLQRKEDANHNIVPQEQTRSIKSASPEVSRQTKPPLSPKKSSLLSEAANDLSLSPATSVSHMRRKAPPEFEDATDSSSDNLYFNAPSPSRSPEPKDQNMDEIIGTIESEIGYLGLGNTEQDSMYEFDEYNTSALNTPNLPIPRSKPVMALADYNSDYSDSSQSMALPVLEVNTSAPPYPVDPFGDSSMDSSPVSPLFKNTSDFGSYSNDFSTAPKESGAPLSESSSTTEMNNMNNSRRSSETFGSLTPTRRSTQTLSIIIPENHTINSGPFFKQSSLLYNKNQTPLQSNRNSTSDSVDPISRTKTSSTISSTPPGIAHHRKSSSISSIWSSNSYRNVNLATIKKSLALKPGEGESSNYVLAIRRSAGTAYNESGPGKWKLPTGILPVDTSATYAKSNGRYIRLAGTLAGRAKKTSGVELKHGHLQPRLLAAEIDDGETTSLGITPKISAAPSTKTNFSDIKSSSSSITAASTNNISRNNSLARTTTEGSTLGTDLQSVVTESTNSGSRKSISSSSSGSISDSNVKVGAYYQHPGYKYDDVQGDDTNDEDGEVDYERQNPIVNDADDYDERPRLVLANPDVSDSD